MDEPTAIDVNAALDSLGTTALRVKEERDSLLGAAKSLRDLIDSTVNVFGAKQIQWLQAKPAYQRLCDAIDKAEQS